MPTDTAKLCARAARILDRVGCSTFLAKFAEDGFRCPGHPDFDLRDHAAHRASERNVCGAQWPLVMPPRELATIETVFGAPPVMCARTA